MPNLYATPTEIKAAMPESYDSDISASSDLTLHDNLIYRLSERISRLIDRETNRAFYPYSETRYFEGSGDTDQWIDDAVALTTVYISSGSTDSDGWVADSDFASSDYLSYYGMRRSPLESYNRLIMDPNGAYSTFPSGLGTVWITGVWAYNGNRSDAWENSGDAITTSDLASDGTAFDVASASGADAWGIAPRFQVGQMLKIADSDAVDEFMEITSILSNAITVVRGRNGTTALSFGHANTPTIYIWRPDPLIKQVCIIESVRLLQRGMKGFEDTGLIEELGTLVHSASLDPESAAMLAPLKRRVLAG